MTEFSLQFGMVAGDMQIGCTDTITGLGPDGAHSVGVSDLRFYVSHLEFRDADGELIEHTLDEDAFQYSGTADSVALVDLTSNRQGACAPEVSAASEATERTHTAITGMTFVDDVASVSFDVGVPQALMKEVIAENTIEGAPSPLGEMYWSWASGYRHFVANVSVTLDDETGDGALHIGSRDCGPMGGMALQDRDSCGFVNTPKVAIDDFDLTTDVIDVDMLEIIEGMGFAVDVREQNEDTGEWEVVGQGPGMACHSAPTQVDCGVMFPAFGLDMSTGEATAAENTVFVKR